MLKCLKIKAKHDVEHWFSIFSKSSWAECNKIYEMNVSAKCFLWAGRMYFTTEINWIRQATHSRLRKMEKSWAAVNCEEKKKITVQFVLLHLTTWWVTAVEIMVSFGRAYFSCFSYGSAKFISKESIGILKCDATNTWKFLVLAWRTLMN